MVHWQELSGAMVVDYGPSNKTKNSKRVVREIYIFFNLKHGFQSIRSFFAYFNQYILSWSNCLELSESELKKDSDTNNLLF